LTYFASFKGVNPRAWPLQIVRKTAYSSRQLDRGVQFIPIGEADEPGTLAADDLVATDDVPILRITSGSALIHGPRDATSRSIGSSSARVLPLLSGSTQTSRPSTFKSCSQTSSANSSS